MNFEASKYDYLSGQCVTITDRFWISILHRAQEVTLPDVWTKFEQDGSFDNFRYVAKKENHTHNGFAFTDGLIYETLRAASDLLHFQDSTTIREQLDRYISLIAEAQNADPDGFISTYTTTEVAECRFGQNGGKIQEQHDLYNAGALFEAAYHHYRVTHKTNLLSCAVRLANYLCTVIGKPPKKNIVAGHQLVEEALLKLYWLFREEPDLAESMGVEAEAYLELSAFLVEMRGRHEGRVSYPQNLLDECQDRIPIRHERWR